MGARLSGGGWRSIVGASGAASGVRAAGALALAGLLATGCSPSTTTYSCDPACPVGFHCGAGGCEIDSAAARVDAAAPPADLVVTCDPPCSGPTPVCDPSGTCVACLADGDCPGGQLCQKLGTLAECVPGCHDDARCGPGLRCCGGACTDTATDSRNCGACDRPCDPRHAGGSCQAGVCRPATCATGWGDCNHDSTDGCEANLDLDTANCGQCGAACALPHATVGCSGSCYLAACSFGWADCNQEPGDGCELAVASDVKNCGACGVSCAPAPHSRPGCTEGLCTLAACADGWSDCNGETKDGCEVQTGIDKLNCGACGTVCGKGYVCRESSCTCPLCVFPHAKSSCANELCVMGACQPGFSDCNMNPKDGCEVENRADRENCGGCGIVCPFGQACVGGACQAPGGGDWRLQAPVAAPSQRFNPGMVYDSARRVVVLFGGRNWNPDYFADTWEWDGTDWTQVTTAHAPAGRDMFGMSYDIGRGVTVVYGGDYFNSCNGNYEDTWEYDGKDWTQIKTAHRPPLRAAPGMVYDAARRLSVLYGGGACVYYGDTWEYDGVDWTERHPAHSPGVRDSQLMAYDQQRGVTTLFSGANNFGGLTGTWEYDGNDWTKRMTNLEPTPRWVSTMSYDPDYAASFVFGGNSGFAEMSDTWGWDGAAWTQQFPLDNPIGRDGTASAYDAARGRLVLFGGNNFGLMFNETWTYGP